MGLALVIPRALAGIVATADLGARVVMGSVLFERSGWDVAWRVAQACCDRDSIWLGSKGVLLMATKRGLFPKSLCLLGGRQCVRPGVGEGGQCQGPYKYVVLETVPASGWVAASSLAKQLVVFDAGQWCIMLEKHGDNCLVLCQWQTHCWVMGQSGTQVAVPRFHPCSQVNNSP